MAVRGCEKVGCVMTHEVDDDETHEHTPIEYLRLSFIIQ
jgi:hypothetical protein